MSRVTTEVSDPLSTGRAPAREAREVTLRGAVVDVSLWILLVVVLLTAALVARRWLPDRAGLVDTAYDAWRGLVPAPRPTVRVVTKRVVRVCRRQRVTMPYGAKAVLPRAFRVGVSAEEYQVVLPLLGTVQDAVAESLLRTARERQWLHDGAPRVVVVEDETVAEGRPRVLSTSLPTPERAGAIAPVSEQPREVRPRVAHREVTSQLPEPEPTRGRDASTPALADPRLGPRTDPREWATRTATETTAQAHRRPDLRPEPTAAETASGVPAVHRLRGRDGATDLVVGALGTVLGRDPGCDVPLDYPAASRRHLRLVATDTGCRLEDLGSRHGTRVNDVPVRQPVLLRPQDTVRIGAQGPSWVYQPSYGSPSGEGLATATPRNGYVGEIPERGPREVR